MRTSSLVCRLTLISPVRDKGIFKIRKSDRTSSDIIFGFERTGDTRVSFWKGRLAKNWFEMDSRGGVLEAGIGVVNFQLLLMSQGLLKNRLTIWAIIKLLLQWWTQLTVSVFLSFQFDWWNSSVVVKAFYLLLNLLTVSNMNLNWLVMRNTSTSHMMFITLTPTFSILRSIRTWFVWSPTTTTFVDYN